MKGKLVRAWSWISRYVNAWAVATIIFVVFSLLLSDGSVINLYRNKERIVILEQQADEYRQRIERDSARLDMLYNQSDGLERYAREEYQMCGDDEEVFVVK